MDTASNSHHRWAKENPDLGVGAVSVESCHSQDYFEREKERIFKRTWLIAGVATDIPNKGDFFLHDVPIADTNLIIVRGRDDVIRAFHNVCPHRSNKLVWDARGCTKSGVFVCPFHRWTFDTAGKLRGVTDEGNFFDLNKNELGLVPVSCDVWQNFIFINLDSQPKVGLLEYLGGIPERLKDFDFSQLRLSFGWSVDERANWKVALDSQNETYHVPFLHSVGQPASLFSGNEMGFVRNCAFERFGRHSMFANAPSEDNKPTPTEALIFVLSPGPFSGDSAVVGNFTFFTIFPNSAIVLFPGGVVSTHRMIPLAPDRTRWEIRTYARPPKNAGEALVQELFKVMGRNALREDAANHERIQSTLKSGAVKHFSLQDEEIQIRFFHKMVDDYVDGKMD